MGLGLVGDVERLRQEVGSRAELTRNDFGIACGGDNRVAVGKRMFDNQGAEATRRAGDEPGAL